MATAAVLLSRLRQARPSSSLSLLYLPRVLSSRRLSPLPASALPSSPTLAFFDAFHSRAFSSRSSDERELGLNSFGVDSQVNSELLKAIADTSGSGEEDAVFPVRVLISMLDSFHELSGFPWKELYSSVSIVPEEKKSEWMPLLCLATGTIHRTERASTTCWNLKPVKERKVWLEGKLSHFKDRPCRTWLENYRLLDKPSLAIVPCFFLWMISIRKMSLNGHPGFDCGGALWFQNLTEPSHGYSGFIFPFLIAGLHYINVQISFGKPVVAEARNIFELLAKYYKRYLDFLTVPLAFVGFCIPQGSQLYWVTNSSFTLVQQITLRHPAVLAMLGLLDKNSQKVAIEKIGASKTAPSPGIQDNIPTEAFSAEKSSLNSPEKWHRIPIEEMSPKELTALAVPFLSSNDKESAIPLLKLALDKDPEYVRALVLMGRILLLKHANEEAIEYFECAISKLSFGGYPTDAEELDLLILSSQWAGVACERQGKRNEGRTHFERIANMEEPEDPTSKGYYFDGLLLLASTLFDAGQKAEAAKYLRLVVVHKPAYKKFLDQCEQDDDIASNLASRRDY